METKSRGNPRCSNPEHVAPKVIGSDGFARCRECKRDYNNKYRETHPERRKKSQEYKRTWIANNPEKYKAQSMANSRRKKLINKYCEACLNETKLELHHPDYSKPLEVITLCKSCHEGVHHEITVA